MKLDAIERHALPTEELARDCPGGAYLSLPPDEREPGTWYVIAERPELGPFEFMSVAIAESIALGLSGRVEAV